MLSIPYNIPNWAGFHHAPGVHYNCPLRDLGYHSEIMGDQDQANIIQFAKFQQQIHDFGLDRHV
jgi:hypothetical protein